MKFIFTIALLILSLGSYAGDSLFQGTWQGVIIKAGQKIDQGTVLYVDFDLVDGVLSATMREETYNSEYYAVKLTKGTQESDGLKYNQIAVVKKNQSSRSKWCRTNGELTYNEETGYLTGTFKSKECKQFIGKIILYRIDFEISKVEESHSSQLWFSKFISDYNQGFNAPAIRQLEKDNFAFEPIYFDFAKSKIRDEHKEFLDALIKIVKGESDLRVKVTGNTDAEGTEDYNVGLSKERAEAIVRYFVKQGLNADRLDFDFKGETNPAATNETSEGRQRNRRVDFEFI